MNRSEIIQVEQLQEQIDKLSPGQREALRAWIIAPYDVRGNWVKYTEDVPGFDFLSRRQGRGQGTA